MSCYCDGERPKIYSASRRIARKAHRCDECCRTIQPGERYEYVFGVWDRPEQFRTCQHCLALRNYTRDNVPCLCWMHSNMINDCIETLREYAHELPGLLFRGYRLQIAITGRKQNNRNAA
ncbi:hypothetical protein ACQE3E_06490 [Methylomonas sp. MED-D]|uniref:hypothetical protein n=1 Tax=Methylomonas sp. MED-D TaxID=3418768 RepID=UPI003D03A2E9